MVCKTTKYGYNHKITSKNTQKTTNIEINHYKKVKFNKKPHNFKTKGRNFSQFIHNYLRFANVMYKFVHKIQRYYVVMYTFKILL